jgi:hypothetical protein
LAYTLTRAAQLDCERGRIEVATARAQEALEYATLLQRATEMALARAVLGCACSANNDETCASEHAAAIAELESAGVAKWASAYFAQKAGEKMEIPR